MLLETTLMGIIVILCSGLIACGLAGVVRKERMIRDNRWPDSMKEGIKK